MSDMHYPVLIVEDDAAVAKTICEWVDEILIGAKCYIASTLEQALIMMKNQDPPFSVIVIDLTLPDADPYSKQSIYSIYEQDPHVKKIVFTGTNATEADIAEVKALGIDTYLVKPKGFRSLMTALRDACKNGE